MSARRLTLQALEGLPLMRLGTTLPALLAGALRQMRIAPEDGDIVVVAQKVVSKAEGRIVDLDSHRAVAARVALAQEVGKDARLVEVILRESTEVVRHKKDVLIVAHRLGFVMANAGVDQSNVGPDGCCARPAAAMRIRMHRRRASRRGSMRSSAPTSASIINDSFGRAVAQWRRRRGARRGGHPVALDLVGAPDMFGRPMRVTEVAVADQIASAASLLMGEANEGLPAVHVRGRDVARGHARRPRWSDRKKWTCSDDWISAGSLRRHWWREVGPRAFSIARRRRSHGPRQHRRRLRASRPQDLARHRYRAVHAGRPFGSGARMGSRGRDVELHVGDTRDRRRELVSARRSRPRDARRADAVSARRRHS